MVAAALPAVPQPGVRRQRSARGRALYEQSRGFELYLSTAKAHQLRFEEGEDIFSRYLPYAIVYGVAERWAEIFAQLEADVKAGAVGVGEISKAFGLNIRKPDGSRLKVDDPALDPLWQATRVAWAGLAGASGSPAASTSTPDVALAAITGLVLAAAWCALLLACGLASLVRAELWTSRLATGTGSGRGSDTSGHGT